MFTVDAEHGNDTNCIEYILMLCCETVVTVVLFAKEETTCYNLFFFTSRTNKNSELIF